MFINRINFRTEWIGKLGSCIKCFDQQGFNWSQIKWTLDLNFDQILSYHLCALIISFLHENSKIPMDLVFRISSNDQKRRIRVRSAPHYPIFIGDLWKNPSPLSHQKFNNWGLSLYSKLSQTSFHLFTWKISDNLKMLDLHLTNKNKIYNFSLSEFLD